MQLAFPAWWYVRKLGMQVTIEFSPLYVKPMSEPPRKRGSRGAPLGQISVQV